MTNRHLTILAVVAAVLTGSVLIVGALEDRQEVTLREGSYLLQGFNPDKVCGIFIKNGNESLTFKRQEERFILTGRVDYPVSNDRINGLVKTVADIRCAERVTADERNHPSLGVTGDSGSLVIRFFNESGQKITGVVIGKDRPGFPGFYTRLEDDKQVYLSTERLSPVSTNEIDYIRCDLPPGNKSDYSRIACNSVAGAFALDLRDGRAMLENIPRGKKQDDQAIHTILESLQRFPVKKIYRKDGLAGLSYRTRLEFHRRDGLVFRIELADRDGRMFARTRALLDDRPATVGTYIPGNETDGTSQVHRDLIATYNRDHDPWVYEIDARYAWLAQRSKTDLLE
jgi:hypothetical protein